MYGTPETEFTSCAIDPAVASGIPPAIRNVAGTLTMTPLSGGPAAPGVSTTAHPIETGGPDIRSSRSAEADLSRDGDRRSLQLRLPAALRFHCHALHLHVGSSLELDVAVGLQLDVARRFHRDGPVRLDRQRRAAVDDLELVVGDG